MSVHKKLQEARIRLQKMELKKTGYNDFSKYAFFELSDFLPQVQSIFAELGLCGVVSFDREIATLTITDCDDPTQFITVTSPTGSAALKGMHEIQNIGAVQSYQRRYLWMAAMEIVEHDALDATAGTADYDPISEMDRANNLIELQNAFAEAYRNEADPKRRKPIEEHYKKLKASFA